MWTAVVKMKTLARILSPVLDPEKKEVFNLPGRRRRRSVGSFPEQRLVIENLSVCYSVSLLWNDWRILAYIVSSFVPILMESQDDDHNSNSRTRSATNVKKIFWNQSVIQSVSDSVCLSVCEWGKQSVIQSVRIPVYSAGVRLLK